MRAVSYWGVVMKGDPNRVGAVNYGHHGFKLLPIDCVTGKPAVPEDLNWESRSYEFDPFTLKDDRGVGLIHSASGTMSLRVQNENNIAYLLGMAGISLSKLKGAPTSVLIKSKDTEEYELLYKTPQGVHLPSCTAGTEFWQQSEAKFIFKCGGSYSMLPSGCTDKNPLSWEGNGGWWKLPALPIPLYQLWIYELSNQNKL